MASNVGTLCGNLVGALLRSVLTDKQLYSWGWRIPFLSGILIAFVGVYLRMYGKDMDTHTEGVEDEKEDTHWSDVFRKENLPALGAATFTPM
jgi:MHS family proline/betaine transporter-like MFS transporter